jgi:ATP-binding cassette subfamily B protein
MKVRQVLWQVIRFTPWLYALSFFMQILRLSILVVPALILRVLFDVLSNHAQLNWWIIGLICLLVVILFQGEDDMFVLTAWTHQG